MNTRATTSRPHREPSRGLWSVLSSAASHTLRAVEFGFYHLLITTVDRISRLPRNTTMSKGAGVVDDVAEEVSWDLVGGRSAPVDQARRPPGSRVPLRTPIVERDAGLRDEPPAKTRVQLRAPRSSEGTRAFARSRLDSASDLAEAARSRSHFRVGAKQPTQR